MTIMYFKTEVSYLPLKCLLVKGDIALPTLEKTDGEIKNGQFKDTGNATLGTIH